MTSKIGTIKSRTSRGMTWMAREAEAFRAVQARPPPPAREHTAEPVTPEPPPPPSAEPEENPGTAGVAPVRQGNGIRWPARRRQRSGEWSQHAIQPVRQRPGIWQAGHSPNLFFFKKKANACLSWTKPRNNYIHCGHDSAGYRCKVPPSSSAWACSALWMHGKMTQIG